MLEVLIVFLAIATIGWGITTYWALTTRSRVTPEVKALQSAIHAFERDGTTLLKIERVDPDQIYLRNPSR